MKMEAGDELLLAVWWPWPGEARGERPDQQRDAGDAGERYGVGQIHGTVSRTAWSKPRILSFSHRRAGIGNRE